MTNYICYDCTGRGDELSDSPSDESRKQNDERRALVVFTVSIGGDGYEYNSLHCPVCGQTRTVETCEEYFERHDNGRYMDVE